MPKLTAAELRAAKEAKEAERQAAQREHRSASAGCWRPASGTTTREVESDPLRVVKPP